MGICQSTQQGDEKVTFDDLHFDHHHEWLRAMFDATDKDDSGTLTVSELKVLMNKLNVNVTNGELKAKLQAFSGDNAKEVNFAEFTTLFEAMASIPPRLVALWKRHAGEADVMHAEDLVRFMGAVQKTTITVQEARAQIRQSMASLRSPTAAGKARKDSSAHMDILTVQG